MTATRRALVAAPAAGCVQAIGERPLRVSDTHPAGYPTVAALIVALLAVTYIPAVTLWLPSVAG